MGSISTKPLKAVKRLEQLILDVFLVVAITVQPLELSITPETRSPEIAAGLKKMDVIKREEAKRVAKGGRHFRD